jgi:hypothetical protein
LENEMYSCIPLILMSLVAELRFAYVPMVQRRQLTEDGSRFANSSCRFANSSC